MKTTALIAVVLIVALVGGVFAAERLQLRRAAGALNADPKRALEAYDALAGRTTWFVDRGEIVNGREAASARLVPGELREHRYNTVVLLCATVLAPPESGHEAACADALRAMPQQHLAFASALLDEGRVEQALGTLEEAVAIYSEQPASLAGARSLQARGGLMAANRWLDAGDVTRLLTALLEIDDVGSIPFQHAAARLAEAGIRRASDHHIDSGDFPGFLAWFHDTCDQLRPRPGLFDACVSVFADAARRMFALPEATPVVDTAVIDVLPLTRVIRRGNERERVAQLTITNDTAASVVVMLRGLGRSGARRTLHPGGRMQVNARPGKYGQVVAADGATLVPYFAIVDLIEGAEYEQRFTTMDLGVEPSASAESDGTMRRAPLMTIIRG